MPGGDSADLYDRAPCAHLTCDGNGIVTSVNHTFLEWTGYSRSELIGQRRFDELLTIASRIFYETHYAPLLRMQGKVEELAVELKTSTGRLPVFASSKETCDDAGHVQYVQTAMMRAVQRRQYERELLLERRMAEEALRAKADLLGVFAHEVRNALNATAITAALLARSELPPAARERVVKLTGSVGAVTALLNEMLELSRMEAGKMTLDPHRFDVRELVTNTVQTLAAQAEAKRLSFHGRVDDRVPQYAVGDAVKIGQVLTNLISNAIKFTHAGWLHVDVDWLGASDQHDRLSFRVTDTGIGIAADRLPRIFDEYVQASPEIASKYGGSGLGLAISRRIVELHGGRLAVQSEPGKGSTFWFELTLERGEPPTQPTATHDPEAGL